MHRWISIIGLLVLAACSSSTTSVPVATGSLPVTTMATVNPAEKPTAVDTASAQYANSPTTTQSVTAFTVTTAPSAIVVVPTATPDHSCFRETGWCIEGRFREFWENNGGLKVFGFPNTPARQERQADTGNTYLVQWFERARFELHPDLQTPYDVSLGRISIQVIGTDSWRDDPREPGPKTGCLWFQETGRNVCDQAPSAGFKTYWETHGLEFDGVTGTSYAESLALFGLPLTEPKVETNTSGAHVLTQWFERARFEWYPNNPPGFQVLLGLLGTQIRGRDSP